MSRVFAYGTLLALQGPIVEHIYNNLLQLYEKFDNPPLRVRILQCLGMYSNN